MTTFQEKIREFNIKVVESHNPVQDPNQFIEFTRGLLGVEGFVICWDNGQRVKCKAEDYLRKHRAKDTLCREKNVIELIVTEKLDDVKAFMDATDLARVIAFEEKFWFGVYGVVEELLMLRCAAEEMGLDVDRKTYAVEFVKKQDARFAPFLFKMFDDQDPQKAVLHIKDVIAKSCGSQSKIDEARWMFNCSWSGQETEGE